MKARRTLSLRRLSPRAVAWGAALAIVAAAHVWVRIRTTEVGYEIGLLRQVRQQAAGEKAELDAEIASLTSPRALDRFAREELGLGTPQPGQVIGYP